MAYKKSLPTAIGRESGTVLTLHRLHIYNSTSGAENQAKKSQADKPVIDLVCNSNKPTIYFPWERILRRF